MLTNAELARHLVQPHGDARVISPSLAELLTWNRADLEAEHQRLTELGPCPSFRNQIVTKSA